MDFPDDREIVETLEWSEEALEERQAALNGDEGSTYSIRNSSAHHAQVVDSGRDPLTTVRRYQLAHLMKIKPALAASNKVVSQTHVSWLVSWKLTESS